MITTRKIRLKPNQEQLSQFYKSCGVARWVYNWTLERQRDNYANGGKFIYDNDLRKQITQLKKQEEFKWLSDVSNNVAKQAVKDACNAYKRFFKGQSGFPSFKSKHRSKLSFFNDGYKLKSKHKKVLIEKVGWVRTSEQLPEAKYYNPRVGFDGKYWYLTVGIDIEPEQHELTGEIVGIDLGIKELAICSNGMVFENINKTKEIKKIEKRLRRLHRSVSRKYKKNKEAGRFVKTCNIIKTEQKIQRLYRRLKNIRDNHIHQSTSSIVRAKPCKIVMEDLDITGMMKNRHLAKAIQEQKLYEFKRQVEYKSKRLGIEFIQVDRYFPSSKLCSSCGQVKKDLKISDRTYHCDCGLSIDRDLNASYNLANYGKLI